jgi:hypothetical protein
VETEGNYESYWDGRLMTLKKHIYACEEMKEGLVIDEDEQKALL